MRSELINTIIGPATGPRAAPAPSARGLLAPERLRELMLGGPFLGSDSGLLSLLFLFHLREGAPHLHAGRRDPLSGFRGPLRVPRGRARGLLLPQGGYILRHRRPVRVRRSLDPHFRRLPIAVHVKEHRPDDDDPGEEGLVVGLEVHGRQAGGQHRHDEHADDGAPDGADASRQRRASDDGGGDRVQLEALSLGGEDGSVDRRVGNPSDARREAGDDIDQHLPLPHVDAGEAGGLHVAPDRIGVSAHLRVGQGDVADYRDEDEEDRAGRYADAGGGEVEEDALEPSAGSVANGEGGARYVGGYGAHAHRDHHGAERDDEGRHLEPGYEEPVEEAEGAAYDYDQQKGGHHRESMLERRAADDGRSHHYGPDGEIDPAGDDDEGDAHRDEPDIVGGVDDVHQGGVGEIVAPEDAEKDIEDDQRGRGKHPFQATLEETLHTADFLSVVCHAGQLLLKTAWCPMVAYPMMASWLAFSMGSSPVSLPSHMTTMRSLMRSISGSSERDHDDRLALLGELVHQRIDLALRADVDAAGGLVEDQDVAVADQPLRDDDLLLVSSREVAQELLEGGRPDVQLMDVFLADLPDPFRVDEEAALKHS